MKHPLQHKVRRVLIANRGEIARRVIRTCRAMGIETVAVFSDVDAHAPHVHEADSREAIGGATAYLSIEAIVAAAKRSGADSVHPGYGFLSENPAFAEALEREGITFIGPSSHTINKLGSKTSAKNIAARANVPVAPTLLLAAAPVEKLATQLDTFASQVGYPVIIKAAAGGGGRGMRLVSSRGDCTTELESAAREAQKAFGSSEIFVEKYIAPARHIEVQIAADQHGAVVALGTRDCSLQRSNQKILEEAPATGLKPGVTEELCAAACRLAKEAGYSNLGTVEFLYTADGLFYFLEVNTRLQVEHPVTEMVTGLDLVELQIRIARGEQLHQVIGSDSPTFSRGHSIEARWCAEEYTGQFVSATGIILDRTIPEHSTHPGTIRADMGYELCSEVSHYYDSLLGKLIVHAPDRHAAIALLDDILARARISGVATNRSLLRHLISTDAFRSQAHTIQGTAALLPSTEQLELARVHAHCIVAAMRLHDAHSAWAHNSPWMTHTASHTSETRYPYYSNIQGQLYSSTSQFSPEGVLVQITSPEAQDVAVQLAEVHRTGPGAYRCKVSLDQGEYIHVELFRDGQITWVHTPHISLALNSSFPQRRSASGAKDSTEVVVTSPIPGKVAALNVKEGDSVTAGALVLVLDSMKMEHPFRATRDGTITSLGVTQGAIIQAGTTLFVLS
jgi:acetyl/propionyl-CoA carboxylase alpha subunit